MLGLVAAMYVQLDIGLADNGDFYRSTAWLTAGLVGYKLTVAPVRPNLGSGTSTIIFRIGDTRRSPFLKP